MPLFPPETQTVDRESLYCDGGTTGLDESGHPRVFLTMGKTHSVDCPYCGRRYVLAVTAKKTGTH